MDDLLSIQPSPVVSIRTVTKVRWRCGRCAAGHVTEQKAQECVKRQFLSAQRAAGLAPKTSRQDILDAYARAREARETEAEQRAQQYLGRLEAIAYLHDEKGLSFAALAPRFSVSAGRAQQIYHECLRTRGLSGHPSNRTCCWLLEAAAAICDLTNVVRP